jgi:hypothetical protein
MKNVHWMPISMVNHSKSRRNQERTFENEWIGDSSISEVVCQISGMKPTVLVPRKILDQVCEATEIAFKGHKTLHHSKRNKIIEWMISVWGDIRPRVNSVAVSQRFVRFEGELKCNYQTLMVIFSPVKRSPAERTSKTR